MKDTEGDLVPKKEDPKEEKKDELWSAIQALAFFTGVGGIVFVLGFAAGFLVRGCAA